MKTALRVARLSAAAVLCFVISACGGGYRYTESSGVLNDGAEDRASLSFPLNGRSIKLELLLRVEGGSALVTIDHPDGRTSETLPVKGSGVHEIRKELPKEPGNWSLGLQARGGTVAYWYALHDAGRYLGLSDEAKSAVGID
jgi:hypothetical protein